MSAASLRVLLVDDEDLARLRLRTLVGDCPDPVASVVGEAGNAAQALVWLATNECDVLLLDVRMPGRDGVQLAEELRTRARPPAIVFVTAHAEHAVRAFDLDATDYLTKPVRRERLQAALQRVVQRLALQRAAPAPVEAAASTLAPAPVIVVSDRGRIVRVPVSEVLYLKAELKYVTLRTAEHTYVLDDSLGDLEQRLVRQQAQRFIRVHRNALVAHKAVRALERRVLADGDEDGGESWAVRVAPVDEWLAVSRRQAAAVREALAAGGV
jgi:two-component system, LytTR family, response regulator AlgR